MTWLSEIRTQREDERINLWGFGTGEDWERNILRAEWACESRVLDDQLWNPSGVRRWRFIEHVEPKEPESRVVPPVVPAKLVTVVVSIERSPGEQKLFDDYARWQVRMSDTKGQG